MYKGARAPIVHASSGATLAGFMTSLRAGSKNKLLMTNGCFDPLHHGHVRGFMTAIGVVQTMYPNNGCELIIAVNSDESVKKLKGENRPFVGQADRLYMLSAVVRVSLLILFNTEEQLKQLLDKQVKPDAYFKGDDYANHPSITSRPGAFVVPRMPGISSSELVAELDRK